MAINEALLVSQPQDTDKIRWLCQPVAPELWPSIWAACVRCDLGVLQ